jgi:glycosyltransferase involved in cell wall biosynthesis
LAQSIRDYEIIIVDDGSTDDSYLEVTRLTHGDSRFQLISKENGGVSSARNIGIRHAKYEYIAFLDADDYWEPTYLEEQTGMIRDFPEAFMWGLSWNNVINDLKRPQKHDVPADYRGLPENYWERGLHLFWTSSIVVRKLAFEKAGYFDEQMTCGEDLDMWFRIILNYPVAFYYKPLANYALDAENRAMNKEIPIDKHLPFFIDKYYEYRKNNKYFKKYFDRECMYRLYPYLLHRKCPKKEIMRILNEIDLCDHKLSFLFRFKFPRLYNWYLELKTNFSQTIS